MGESKSGSVPALELHGISGVALAALVFGATSALQYLFQTTGWNLPYQAFLALPYLLTLLGLAGVAGRVHAPASLGVWTDRR